MDELIRRAQAQDQEAYRELFEQWYPRAWRVSRALGGDRTLAEDALQEALIRFWRAMPRVRDAERAESYFLRIVVNETRRQLSRRREQPTDDWAEGRGGEGRGADQSAEERESADELQRAVQALPGKLAAVLQLHYWGGFSVAEVATLLRCSPSSVKMRLLRGRQALRAQLEREQVETEGMTHEWSR